MDSFQMIFYIIVLLVGAAYLPFLALHGGRDREIPFGKTVTVKRFSFLFRTPFTRRREQILVPAPVLTFHTVRCALVALIGLSAVILCGVCHVPLMMFVIVSLAFYLLSMFALLLLLLITSVSYHYKI